MSTTTDNHRYAYCEWCGDRYNISAKKVLPFGIYICAVCERQKGMTPEKAVQIREKKGDAS